MGAGADNARQWDSGELPVVGIPHTPPIPPSRGGGTPHACGHPCCVGRVEGQPLGGSECQRVTLALDGAGDSAPDGAQAKCLGCRSAVHRHVEGDLDGGIHIHQLGVLLRRDPHDLRRLGGERPGVVLGQDAASGVAQPSRDAYGVCRAAGQGLGRGEDIDGGVEPLATAGDGRVECEETPLSPPHGRGRYCHQRDNGTIKDDGDGASGLHVLRIGGGDDLGHLQVADGAEAETVGSVKGIAVGRFGLGAQGGLVLGIPLEVAGGLEAHGTLVGPLEATAHLRAEAESSLDGGMIHRPVEDQFYGPIGWQFLAPLRRALDDDGGYCAGRGQGVGGRSRGGLRSTGP